MKGTLRDRFLASTWAYPVALFCVTRASLMLISGGALGLQPWLERAGGAPELHPHLWIDGLCRWDCGIFIYLARDGYSTPDHANFFPLLPLLMRALAVVGIPYFIGVLVVANVAALLAGVVTYRVFCKLASPEAARWSLAVLAAFPFSFFQAAGYPESLMMLFTALAVWYALEGHGARAGIALGIAVLARHVSILIGLVLPAAQLQQRGFKGFFKSPLQVLSLLLPFAISGVYLLWQQRVYGDPFTFWNVRANWGGIAWWGAREVLSNPEAPPMFRLYLLFALVPTVGVVALWFKPQWRVLAAGGAVMMVVFWAVGAAGLGRYSASCWPAYLPIGVALVRWPMLQTPVLGFLGLCQGVAFVLHVHQYPIN